MNISDQNIADENQYCTSGRMIAHLENYYKFYGALLIFCLATFFLLSRKKSTKAGISHDIPYTNHTNIIPVKQEICKKTNFFLQPKEKQPEETLEEEKIPNDLRESPDISNLHNTDTTPTFSGQEIAKKNEAEVDWSEIQKSLVAVSDNLEEEKILNDPRKSLVAVLDNSEEEKILNDPRKSPDISNSHHTDTTLTFSGPEITKKNETEVDWSEIQKNLGAVLDNIDKCFNLLWVDDENSIVSKEQILPFQPIDPEDYPIIQELRDCNGSEFRNIPLYFSKNWDIAFHSVKRINNWKIKISAIDIILIKEGSNWKKTSSVTLRNEGSWLVKQTENSILIDTYTLLHPITFNGESFSRPSRNSISFTNKDGVSWQSTYEEINKEKNRSHKNELQSFFKSLRSVVKLDLKDLIDTLQVH